MTTPPEHRVTATVVRRGRASPRPPGVPEEQSRRRPPSRHRPEPGSSQPRRRASASGPRSRQQLPPGVDAVCDGLTVTFDIRYVDGEEGDRVSAAQVAAITALLNWLVRRDAKSAPEQVVVGRVDEKGRAA